MFSFIMFWLLVMTSLHDYDLDTHPVSVKRSLVVYESRPLEFGYERNTTNSSLVDMIAQPISDIERYLHDLLVDLMYSRVN